MSGIIKDNEGRSSGLVKSGATTYDDNKLQSNIALLGFKTAVNGSLAKYNLQDQIIDEYEDASGIDAGASTNERLTSGVYDGATTVTPSVTENADVGPTVDGDYTYYKWTSTGAGSYVNDTTQDHEWLVVAGGGAGGDHQPGGGGAGGFRAGTTLSLTGGNTYTVTVGVGGVGLGDDGDDSSIAGTGITTITSTGGGGGGTYPSTDGATGGSGGGGAAQGGMNGGAAIAITQYTAAGETTTVQGYAGGTGMNGVPWRGAGGGGASEVGESGADGADGGDGVANSITGASVTYAGGGGGGSTGGDGGAGGGGDDATDGDANTGGGGGGQVGGTHGDGGSGIVILRRLTTALSTGVNLTLQSTDTTAMTEPDYADMVILIENAEGTATLDTDIKGWISKDSGSTFTQGNLVDEGTWGTNKKIIAFHDLDISAQSGTSMCYKITTHNQSASKVTNIHATSIGWKA